MTFKNPDFSSNSPYYDDFEEAKNFLKILFKPGYAVQARELTQLQTILQSQVAKFADHIFQDGSQVFGGKIQIVNTPYVRLEKYTQSTIGATTNLANDYLTNLPTNLLKVYSKSGTTFTELATVKISYFEPSGYSAADDYAVAFYNVISIAETQNGTFDMQREYYIGSSTAGPFVKVINPTQQTTTPVQYTVEPFGNGYLVTVDDGIFYIDGYFVTTQKQTISLFKKSSQYESDFSIDTGLTYNWASQGVRLFNKPSHRIGYTINRQIVTATEDSTLNDPARGFYNYNAPGADRYKISLELTQIEYRSGIVDIDNYVTTDFIQILRTTNGVVDYIKDKSSYSQILDLFAKRTQDESGSYTVKPFIAEVKNHLRKDRYVLTVSNDSITSMFPATSFRPAIDGYVWAGSAAFNPYTSPSLANEPFVIAKIVDVIGDYDASLATPKSLKIVVELQNANKFAFGPASYFLKNTSTGAITGFNISGVELQIDSKGTYSLSDVPVGDPTKMTITMQPGKAYVYGYNYETFAPRSVDYVINGNQTDIKVVTGQNVEFEVGNYVKGVFVPRITTNTINYEQMPSLDLVDVDTNTFLIYPANTTTAERRIYAWAPFLGASEDIQGDMIDMVYLTDSEGLDGARFPHESVIFVAE
jgi:hypothetical protein